MEELNPALGTMTTRIKEGSERTTSHIVTEVQIQMKDLRRELSSQMMELAAETEKKLQMRDLSPLKIKLKWAGLGALASMMLFTLLRLLKIF